MLGGAPRKCADKRRSRLQRGAGGQTGRYSNTHDSCRRGRRSAWRGSVLRSASCLAPAPYLTSHLPVHILRSTHSTSTTAHTRQRTHAHAPTRLHAPLPPQQIPTRNVLYQIAGAGRRFDATRSATLQRRPQRATVGERQGTTPTPDGRNCPCVRRAIS